MDDQAKQDNQDKPRNDSGDGDNQEAVLIELKARALGVLLPMVDKIEEPPERKFEILMTAARSSDDPALLAKTLDAAQQINGDSAKANAILDVLNEINYHLNNG